MAGVLAAAGTAAVLQVVYRLLVRDPLLTWGATDDEARRRLPGDELLEDADVVATRAIDIDAPSAAVWPWLVQMGSGRGGAYTYDWIENLLGLGMHSADRIVLELQHVEVGDVVPMKPDGTGLTVAVLDPQRVLAFRSPAGDWVWTFVLLPRDGQTRLVSRNRIRTAGASLGTRLAYLVIEPGSWVMERKMLLGIKRRAEGST
jgi:hypothetical protein